MLRIGAFGLLLLLIACSKSGEHNSSLLQEATGAPGDMVLIMDSTQWRDPLGDAVRDVFMAEAQGLPREEPLFDVSWVHPNRKIRLLKQVRNLVYVFTLDQKTQGTRIITDEFTPESLQRIMTDTSFYVYRSDDQFSRGQTVIYLFGQTEEQLIRHLEQHGDQITDVFKVLERNRLIDAVSRTAATRNLTSLLDKQYGFTMRFPIGYRAAETSDQFVWLRQVESEADQSVFVAWKPYRSENQLMRDSVIAWRNEIARNHLFEDPLDPQSHLTTETTVPFKPVITRQVSFRSHYATQLIGLWKTNTNTMGGPFISYCMVDEAKARLYYLEGFTFSPAKDQREIIRKLDAILWTFESSGAKENL